MTDPTEESRAAEEREQLLRRLDAERAFLEAVLRQLPLGVIIAEAPSGTLILANEQMEQIWRQPFRPAVDVGEYDQYPGFHLDGRPYRPEEWPLARSITTGEVVSGEEISIQRGDGTRGIIRVNSVPIRDRDGRITAGVVTFEDITERRRTQAAEHLLVEASTLLAASLDYEATLQAVARLALPALADLCVLDMADEEGALRRLAVAHADPAKQALAAKLLAYPPEAGGSQPAPQAVRTGEPAIHPEISDELLARISRHPEHLEVLRALAPRSAMVVPLVARGRILGVITFLSAESGHRYTPADLSLAEELARRCALAVDNARLYEAERQAHAAAERAAERMARLQAVTSALSEALTAAEVAEVVVEASMAALGAHAGVVTLLSEREDTLRLIHSAGYSDEQLDGWYEFSLETAVPLAEAVREGAPVLLESPGAFAARFPDVLVVPGGNGSAAWAALPLVVDGRAAGALGLSFSTRRAFPDDDRALLMALARQCSQALERARLYEAEQQARAEAEAAQRRLEFLAEASGLLASSLDYGTTLQSVARLAVPQMADWCAVDILEEDENILRLAVAHVDPAKVEWAHELQHRYPPDANAPRGVPQVLRTQRPELLHEISDEVLQAAARDAEHLRLLREVGFTSVMIVPLVARGQALGAITFATAESGHHYGAEDLALAEELARSAAQAMDNARLYREAQEAIRLRDAFFSIASHELRTPLTALQGYAELLQRRAQREGTANPRDQQALRAIHTQSVQLRRLIDLLLDLSRIQTGRLELEQVPVDLVALVERVTEGLRVTLERHTLEVIAPEAEVTIEGDALRLEQVLQNLLQNAIKYSPAGGPVVVRLERGEGLARLEVSDRGIGIPPDALPQLFTRFFRAKNVEARQIGGLGLGLYVVHEIVEAHGGRIEVASEPGVGSTFIVEFPRLRTISTGT